MPDLEAAWSAVHEATPTGWYVGRPSYHDERREWVMYAFDPSERPMVGLRSREWTAVAESEAGVVLAREPWQLGPLRAKRVTNNLALISSRRKPGR